MQTIDRYERSFRLLAGFVLSWLCLAFPDGAFGDSTNRPNVVLIIGDDQGWTDYGFMAHPHIQTPSLDKLAAAGLTFTRGYSTVPLCRPALASMLTGLYPHQHGITGNDPTLESNDRRYSQPWLTQRSQVNNTLIRNIEIHPTLPRLLGQKGYLSLQTGKWWEGHWKHGGFTHGMTHGEGDRGGRHGDEGLKIGREGLQPIRDFLDEAQRAGCPFFLWYAPFLPHSPHTPPKRLEEKYLGKAPTPQIARYWAMCEWFDETCGQLLDDLEQKGMGPNTLVLYVCDNGWIQNPTDDNQFMPRSKQSPYEMGIRTPILVKWPVRLKPRFDEQTLASSLDLAPTILEACGVAAPAQMPGLNLLNADRLTERTTLFAETYAHDVADVSHPARSLRYRIVLDRQWKLILPHSANVPDGKPELFNLLEDPHETQNLADRSPHQVAALAELLNRWWTPR